MSYLYFDIETLPVIEPAMVEKFRDRIKPPGNIKKPESIKKWFESNSNIDNAISKTALDGAWGKVFCIAYAIDDGELQVIQEESEIGMFSSFKKVTVDENNTPRHLVGHYIKGFDIPFMHKRMLVNGMGPLFRFGAKAWEYNASCIGEMFSCDPRNVPKLDTLCCAFDVDSPKSDMDGSKVYQAFLDGKHHEINTYAMQDVRAIREIHKIMMRV